eukprot:2664354-Pleurochrysis_carterae.AAC.1
MEGQHPLPCNLLHLGSLGWPSSLSGQEIRAPSPEGLSTRRPSPPAGERHKKTTRQVRRPCPDQKIRAQSTHSPSSPCFLLHLGSIGWPSWLSDQGIRALLPEGL